MLILLTRMKVMAVRKTLRRRGSIALTLLVCVGALTMPATARPQERLEDIQERQAANEQAQAAKGAQADRVSNIIAGLDARRKRAESRVDALDAELDRLDTRIADVQADLSRAQQRLSVITAELQTILRRLVKRTDAFTARAIATYKAGSTAYLDSLLSAESFGDLVERSAYYESALDSDAKLVEQIEALRSTTEARRAEVDQRRHEIAEAKLALEQDRDELASVRSQRAAVLAERKEAVAAKRDVLAGIHRDQAHLEAIERELAREEGEIQGLLPTASGPLPQGSGQLMWPAVGPVSSGFGPRVHPIFGDVRMHTGIDISAPYGASVFASDDGVVAFAGVMSGYGNAVIVDHGGGLATTYNHLSAFSVGEGQSVSRGTVVGAVGCTGYCTGPHLHFEVRVNGTPVDPMPYLQ
jgi:murein DD-endopeptidase MepM/ murein hydrolase activator NlpD